MLKKRRVVIVGLIGLIGLIYFLFNRSPPPSGDETEEHAALAKRASVLKAQLDESDRVIANMEKQIELLEKGFDIPSDLVNDDAVHLVEPIVISNRGQDTQLSYNLPLIAQSQMVCDLAEAPPATPDVQMYEVLESVSFDDEDGGVWKQGYPIHYEESLWSKEKPLKVFVIPHSHDDPGWIKTFDSYYSAQVQHILDNMVTKLAEHKKMKFIYAEISFFSKWWSTATPNQKDAVKRYLREGRLELVTGGWVMPDEASSHYWALIDQLIEGHTWIRENIGESNIPRSGWSIDPFGHTSTMAYILKESGLRNMLIQRVHYSIKKHFAENKYLEFNWRQMWDDKGSTDILCHMMPFYSYDVPHTCGPDPKICCQFDFQRLPGGKLHCPWRKEPQAITDSNVNEKAFTLLDQYRKKSTLYKSNVVLIPLGDDFRYDSAAEWDKQYLNYQKLFDYMNQKEDWHVQAQFGTLSDYFNALREEMGSSDLSQSSLDGFPSLSGDFYTYADRVDHYWSGYFTSRPFYKHWDRHLESTLRSAEIIFSLAQASAHNTASAFKTNSLYDKLTYARRSLGLFQHHDGITGTAKAAVVVDYGTRMLKGWKSAYDVIRASAQQLVGSEADAKVEMFDVEWLKEEQDDLETKFVYEFKQGHAKKFVIYNSSPHEREELVRIWVSTVPITIYDPQFKPIICQISPYFTDHFDDKTSMSHERFKLSFLVKVPPLGLATYTVEGAEKHPCMISSVSFYNVGSRTPSDNIFKPDVRNDNEFTIQNDQIQVIVSASTGMIQSLKDKKSGKLQQLSMSFVKYKSAVGSDHTSGAYLFIPAGGSQAVATTNPLIRVVTGNLFHEVKSFTSLVEHHVRVVNTPGAESLGVEVVNIDFIKSEDNTELAMQLSTQIGDDSLTFYSDMNGFTMHKRKYHKKLFLQGNVYPMTSMAYLEDKQSRVSLLAAQSAAVLSPTRGNLQVVLDRRLNQDDNRGLGEPVKDNKRTESKFFILFETRARSTRRDNRDKTIGYPSMTANIIYQHLVSPLITLPLRSGRIGHPVYEPLTKSLPCELNLVNLRSIRDFKSGEVEADSLMLVHHQSTDCSLQAKGLTCGTGDGKLDIRNMFRHQSVNSVERRTLTNLEPLSEDLSFGFCKVKPMNVAAYKLTL